MTTLFRKLFKKKKKYRVKQKGSMYVLQSYCTFYWIDIDEYSDRTKAEIMCNGMRLQQKGWPLQ